MSDVVSDFNTQPYKVHRSTAGSYTEGEFVSGSVNVLDRMGNVQIATGKDLNVVPENSRSTENITVISNGFLDDFYSDSEENETIADVVEWNSKKYKVVHVDNWSTNGFWQCVAAYDPKL